MDFLGADLCATSEECVQSKRAIQSSYICRQLHQPDLGDLREISSFGSSKASSLRVELSCEEVFLYDKQAPATITTPTYVIHDALL